MKQRQYSSFWDFSVSGFTLIELLIVIAVLGILAVAVLSAINPIEQINRSRDTGSRSDAEQLINALDRYYASKGFYAWQFGATSTNPDTGWEAVATSWTDDDTPAQQVLTKLSSGGTAEIKASFVNRIIDTGYNTLYVYNRGQVGDSTYICFLPKSSAFQDEAGTRCNADLPVDYPANSCSANCDANNNCWACLP